MIVNMLLFFLMYYRRGRFLEPTLTKSSIAQFLQHARHANLLASTSSSSVLQGAQNSASSIATSFNREHQFGQSSQSSQSSLAVASNLATDACDIHASTVFAVVPTVQSTSTAGSSKFAPPYDHYVRLLQQILKLSRQLLPKDIYLQIFLDVETLHPAHRLWCRDIPWCHLQLLSNASDYNAIIQNMHDLRLCASRYVILPDTANIDPAFMLRLQMLPTARVACLASQASSPSSLLAGNSLANMCPSRAFQIPTAFRITASKSTPASPHADAIITAAVQQGVYAGAFNIVNVL